ncbi:MAG: ABC transporter substrate-binding protein [Rhodospirillales bacterium]|nr:ABC transporter substrate-binding protein [Rhodospirillales bacterium]
MNTLNRLTRLGLALFAMLFAAALPLQATPKADTPERVVEGFHATLLAVMKQASSSKVGERFALLAPKIKQSFDLPFMIRIAASSHWQESSDKERAALAGAFQRMSIAVYASRFDGYSGESFKTLKTSSGPGKPSWSRPT